MLDLAGGNPNAMPLSKAAIGWFVDKTLAKSEDAKSPMLNLTTMADLKGLPTATVVNGEIDPIFSDGEMPVAKLKAAGVKTTHLTYKGATHEFFGLDAVVADAKTAQDAAARDLKAAFGTASR